MSRLGLEDFGRDSNCVLYRDINDELNVFNFYEDTKTCYHTSSRAACCLILHCQ